MRFTDFEIVKVNMLSMLKYSRQEYKQYQDTKRIIYLQQACEKLFNVIEGYISYINKKRIEWFQEARTMIKEQSLIDLLYDGRDLHRFFYHGTNEMPVEDAVRKYQSVLKRMDERIKRMR